MWIKSTLLTTCLIALAPMLLAQLPSCSMYHFTITDRDEDMVVKDPVYLTYFNDDGYNNQPCFFDEDIVYFTTDYYGGGQTEVARFDLSSNVLTRISFTEESEYSPIPAPGDSTFSCVRVEKDNDIQTLRVYPLDGLGYPSRLLHGTINIGYHAWLDAQTLAIFLVEEPHHNLAIADAISERRKIILDKIGRTLKVNDKGELLFVHKLSEDTWVVKAYNKELNQSYSVVRALPNSEDFEILDNGTLLMGSGSLIYKYTPGQDDDWVPVVDLSTYGISNISRIAAQKSRLIIVDKKT